LDNNYRIHTWFTDRFSPSQSFHIVNHPCKACRAAFNPAIFTESPTDLDKPTSHTVNRQLSREYISPTLSSHRTSSTSPTQLLTQFTMSSIPAEAGAVPDPAATSVANDTPLETAENSAPTVPEVEMADPVKAEANGEIKEAEKTEAVKTEEVDGEKKNGEANKPRTNYNDRRNGNNRNFQGNNYQKYENQKKYDPTKWEKSSDHQKIRNQVSSINLHFQYQLV
jgi:hypothetical protein